MQQRTRVTEDSASFLGDRFPYFAQVRDKLSPGSLSFKLRKATYPASFGGFKVEVRESVIEKTGSSTDEEYLHQFIDKNIHATGKVSTFEKAKNNTDNRLVIRFERRAEIKPAN